MSNTTSQLVEDLKARLASTNFDATVKNTGVVLEVGDGVARVSGLSEVASMEMVKL